LGWSTQGTFYLARADPHKGKFRSFLLSGLKNLLHDQRDKAACLKRGGGQKVISFDAEVAENRYRVEPMEHRSPDHLFERSWAAALLERAAVRLHDEYVAAGKAELFDELTEYRLDNVEQRPYAEVAARFGLSGTAIKSAIRRLRQRHQQLVREEIAQTVSEPAEVEDEVRYLLTVIGD
jgi:DNA-directed RNA polymerase specialized sigma24 family protein